MISSSVKLMETMVKKIVIQSVIRNGFVIFFIHQWNWLSRYLPTIMGGAKREEGQSKPRSIRLEGILGELVIQRLSGNSISYIQD